jgi:hypothetical protein
MSGRKVRSMYLDHTHLIFLIGGKLDRPTRAQVEELGARALAKQEVT